MNALPRVGVAVFVRPDWDDLPMRYASYWVGTVVDGAMRLGWVATDLYGDDAVRSKVEEAITATDPIFFYASGHGDTDVFTGQRRTPVFVACENDGILAGRITYLLSCLCGVGLGPSIVGKGGRAFLGYSVEFTWLAKPPYNPAVDEYARAFMEMANSIALTLLRGGTAREAYNAGVATANRWIDYWSRSTDPNAPEIVKWLTWDRDGLVLYGAGGVRVTRPVARFPAVAWQLPMAIGLGSVLFTR